MIFCDWISPYTVLIQTCMMKSEHPGIIRPARKRLKNLKLKEYIQNKKTRIHNMKKTPRIITALILTVITSISLTACQMPWQSGVDRPISIQELNGSATITSVDTSVTDAKKGKQLSSGDSVNVYSDSDMTLLIDKDKHLVAGADTQFWIEATGKKKSTKTMVVLSEGSAQISIDNTLGADESFDVVTPNAMFSVRGTVFNVTVTPAGDGYKSSLSVTNGMVEVNTVEDDSPVTEFIGEGQSGEYSGKVPDIERWFDVEDEPEDTGDDEDKSGRNEFLTPQTSVSSVDEIPEERDGSKGIAGVYRAEYYMIAIAEGVPYAANKNYSIWVDDAVTKPFCMVEVPLDTNEPYFPREAEQVNDTLITDFTADKDTGEHLVEAEYYIDGDLMYYHLNEYEIDHEEFMILQRTDEDPVEIYNSYIEKAHHENSEEKAKEKEKEKEKEKGRNK